VDEDTGKRGGYAVGVSLDDTNADTVRLIFDDLEFAGGEPNTWKQWAFFTYMDIPRKRAVEHELTEREYAAIGEALLARIVALRSLDSQCYKEI
jgi:hypothetical protein